MATKNRRCQETDQSRTGRLQIILDLRVEAYLGAQGQEEEFSFFFFFFLIYAKWIRANWDILRQSQKTFSYQVSGIERSLAQCLALKA